MENPSTPQSPQPNTLPPSPNSKTKLLHWGIIILVAVAVGAAIVYYALRPQTDHNNPIVKHQDEFQGWKTYTNTQYGFEFKYPASESVRTENNFTNLPTLSIAYYKDFLWDQTLEAYLNREEQRGPGDIVSTGQKFEPYNQNGLEGFVSTDNSLQIFVQKNEDVIIFRLLEDAKKQMFDQILSTFKFLDKEPSLNNYEYELRHLSWESFDAELIQIDKTSKKEKILVPSVKAAFPDIQKQFNLILSKLSFPPNSNRLYFEIILSETDASISDLAVYDIATNQFSKLKVSGYYLNFGSSTALSPDGKRVVSIDYESNSTQTRSESLYLLDLDRDESKQLVTAKDNETFNICTSDGCLGIYANLKWLDSNTFEFAVYDKNKEISDNRGGLEHPLIEIRKIKIP